MIAVLDELKCGCISTTAKKVPKNCTAGGAGSTQCGVTDGGDVAVAGWTKQCEVSCGSGYYSCCTADPDFVYPK